MDLGYITANCDVVGDRVVAALHQAQAMGGTAHQQSGLAQISLQVDKLVGPWKGYVFAGTWTYEKWAQLAKEQYATIRSFAPEIESASFLALLSNTLKSTGSDLADLGQSAKTAFTFAVPTVAIYVLVVLVLLAVIRVGR